MKKLTQTFGLSTAALALSATLASADSWDDRMYYENSPPP